MLVDLVRSCWFWMRSCWTSHRSRCEVVGEVAGRLMKSMTCKAATSVESEKLLGKLLANSPKTSCRPALAPSAPCRHWCLPSFGGFFSSSNFYCFPKGSRWRSRWVCHDGKMQLRRAENYRIIRSIMRFATKL